MREYIVAYSTTRCDISVESYNSYLVKEYWLALQKYPDKIWGDVVCHNNQVWCTVYADYPKDALDKAFIKMDEDLKERLELKTRI